jgi:hypothetical protein
MTLRPMANAAAGLSMATRCSATLISIVPEALKPFGARKGFRLAQKTQVGPGVHVGMRL